MSLNMAGRILESTRDLYVEEGISGVSMRKVAERVGITATAIYRHYANKTVLLQHVVAEGFKIFGSYLHEALEGETPIERLRLTGEAYARFAVDHPQFYKVMFLSPHDFDLSDELSQSLERRNMATFQFMLDRIRECMDAGVLKRDDPEKVALSIWTMSHGIMSLYLAGSRFIPDAKALDRLRLELNLRLFQGLMADAPTVKPRR
jgi:AcrR family transcriptional regulator